MAPLMKGLPAEAASGFAEGITLPSDGTSPANEGVFLNHKTHIKSEEILRGAELIKFHIREELYEAVHDKRVPVFHRNAILLKAAVVNNHDTDHQDRDAYIALKVFEAFPDKLDPAMIEPVLVGSMVHDMQYIPAARQYAGEQLKSLREKIEKTEVIRDLSGLQPLTPIMESIRQWSAFIAKLEHLDGSHAAHVETLWNDGSFPEQIGKRELDPHAELGEAMLREWYEDPELKQHFDAWTPEQKEVAAKTIRDHSVGTEYDPFSASHESKVLRLADKLDNTYHRVPEWMLSEKSVQDPFNFHRYVPTAIRAMSVEVDRAHETFNVFYDVDPSQVELLMRRSVANFNYTKDSFLSDFERAYNKSMRAAAEVSSALFAHGNDLYNAQAIFKVHLRFPDGSEEVRTYGRQPTPPSYG